MKGHAALVYVAVSRLGIMFNKVCIKEVDASLCVDTGKINPIWSSSNFSILDAAKSHSRLGQKRWLVKLY
jgi:hypothetical protein